MDSSTSMQRIGQDHVENTSIGSAVIEIRKVTDAIKQGKEIINESTKGDHIVLFWGFSGVGKSSAIITLNGQQILGYHKGDPIIIEANPTQNQRGVKIETLVKAGTIYPAVLELKYQNGKQKVMLWDMPGIGQTRGATQSLINSYFIHRIFEFQTSVKLVFTIEFKEVVPNSRGANLQKTLTDLTKVLGNFQNYHQAVAIMITKVPPINNEKKIIGFFEQILTHLPSINQNACFRFLLTKLIQKQIPLIISKQPKISSVEEISKENAVNVTYQYTDFIKEMYTIATTKLKPASFPRLYSPAMSSNQIGKCKTIVDETHLQIDSIINNIKIELPKFITSSLQSINASLNLDEFKNGLQSYKKTQKFVHQISQKGKAVKNSRKKQQVKLKFDELKELFESYRFISTKSRQGQRYDCIPMADLNDSYIMIKFLNTLSFRNTEIQIRWEDQSEIILLLFKELFDCKLEDIIQQNTWKLNQQTKTIVKQNFSLFIQSIQTDKAYKNWVKQFKIVPALILSSSKLDRNSNHLQYFQELINRNERIQFSNTSSIKRIIEFLKLKQTYLPQSQANKFLDNQIKPIYAQKATKLVDQVIDYKNWDSDFIENAMDQYQSQNKHLFQKKNLTENQKTILKKLAEAQKQHKEYVEMHQQTVVMHQQTITQKDSNIDSLKFQIKKIKNQNPCCCCDIY